MKKSLLILVVAALAALAGALPARAATVIGGGNRAGGYASAPTEGTGPQAGEVPLGSFVSGATTRSPARHGAATGLKGNPTCANQCITGGVAYGRGPDARLVVTTDTPATIRIIVSGPAGFSHQEISGAGVTSFSADFDLEADTQYQGVVIASDAYGNHAERAGSFRTLERNARLLFNEAHILDAPFGNDGFSAQVFFEDHWFDQTDVGDAVGGDVPLGAHVIDAHDTDRFLWAGIELNQSDADHSQDPCEVVPETGEPEYGPADCSWSNTAWADDGHLDLDARPAGQADPNSYFISVTMQHANSVEDPGLPGGYGDALAFTVPAAVHVTWTTG